MKNLNWWIIGGTAIAVSVGGYMAYKHFTTPGTSGFRNYSAPSKCSILLSEITKHQQQLANLQVQLKVFTAKGASPRVLDGFKQAIAVQRTLILKMQSQYNSSCGGKMGAGTTQGCDCNKNGAAGTLQVTGVDSGSNAVYDCVPGGCSKSGAVASTVKMGI